MTHNYYSCENLPCLVTVSDRDSTMTSISLSNLLFKVSSTKAIPPHYALIILSVRAQNFQIRVGLTEFKHSGTILRSALI